MKSLVNTSFSIPKSAMRIILRGSYLLSMGSIGHAAAQALQA
jgi:hypothetical protein